MGWGWGPCRSCAGCHQYFSLTTRTWHAHTLADGAGFAVHCGRRGRQAASHWHSPVCSLRDLLDVQMGAEPGSIQMRHTWKPCVVPAVRGVRGDCNFMRAHAMHGHALRPRSRPLLQAPYHAPWVNHAWAGLWASLAFVAAVRVGARTQPAVCEPAGAANPDGLRHCTGCRVPA